MTVIIKKNERVQQLFRVNKLNAWHIGTFVYDEHYQDWIIYTKLLFKM